MTDEPIDIIQQFANQYAKEQMLAFFEFKLECGAAEPVSGLCKISKPKSGSSKLNYLSLTFVVDTDNAETRRAVDDVLAGMEGSALHARLPHVLEVVPDLSMNAGGETYVGHMDLLLESAIDPGRVFIADTLMPALDSVLPIQVIEVVWWGSLSTSPAKAAASSVVTDIGKYLNRHWGTRKK
jgi:hypothetical protein